jgi:hypothetical protein
MKKLHLILATSMLALPLIAEGQTLADVARAEEARRKSISKTSKVYTNETLKEDITVPVPANVTPAEPQPDAQVPSDPLPGGEAEPVPPVKDQKYWSGRMNAAREALERSEIFAQSLQSRINALSTEFVNRDDPAQRAQIDLERQRALTELDRVKKEIDAHTKAIAAIEEEARKAGVPPGWLR